MLRLTRLNGVLCGDNSQGTVVNSHLGATVVESATVEGDATT